MASPTPVISKPGCKRDGTRFDGEVYVDFQHCRIQRGLPRKMLGTRRLTNLMPALVYGMEAEDQDNLTYLHAGSASRLDALTVDSSGNVGTITNRLPGGFVSDANNCWQMDVIYDENTQLGTIICLGAPNLQDPLSTTSVRAYYGDLTDITGTLAEITGNDANGDALTLSGGVVCLHPYTFLYGNDGRVVWSLAGDPSDYTTAGAGVAYIADDKVLKGLPVRGGAGNAPSGMFWTGKSLVRAAFVGSSAVFDFDTLSNNITVLSAASIVEYDGVFYWAGVDRFFIFDGVVRELPNPYNFNWFFDGINQTYRGKCFAFGVPHWGEIWFCYPRGDATECSHAVIYNVREQTWYDTELLNGGRSSQAYSQFHRSPIMTGVQQDPDTLGYKLWQHETGTDEIDGAYNLAIQSYFETSEFTPVTKGVNKGLSVGVLELDFVQSGDMTVSVQGQNNPRDLVKTAGPLTFTSTTEWVGFKASFRMMRFRFESNVAGGNYEMGMNLAHFTEGDGRFSGTLS